MADRHCQTNRPRRWSCSGSRGSPDRRESTILALGAAMRSSGFLQMREVLAQRGRSLPPDITVAAIAHRWRVTGGSTNGIMAPVLDPRETADLQGRTARGPPLSEAKQEVLAQRGIAFAHEHGSGLARRGPRRRFCPLPAAPRKWPVCRGKARGPENQECSSGTGCSWETVVVPSTTANAACCGSAIAAKRPSG